MTQNKNSKTFKDRIRSTVESVDSYALPITLSYNGRDMFRTLPGGILTILSRLVILLSFFVQIPEVINQNKIVTRKTIRISLDNDHSPYELNLQNFDFAIRILNPYGVLSDELLNNRSKYFKYEFSTSSVFPQQVGNQTIMASINTNHEFVQCTNDRLGNLTDQTAGLQLTQNGWACPDTINEKLLGSPFGLERTTLRIRIVPCNQAVAAGIEPDNITCASDAEIEKVIQGHFIQIAILNQYFDENEFEGSPIKKELNVIVQNIAPNMASFKANLYQKVTITTQDSWFGSSFNNKEYQFWERVDLLNDIQGYVKPGIHDMITIMVSKYDKEETVVRRVTSLMDILATSGGLSSVIMFVCLILSKTFQEPLYHLSMINKLFKQQNQTYDNQDLSPKNSSNEERLDIITHDLNTRKSLGMTYKQYIKHKMLKVIHCLHIRRIRGHNPVSLIYTDYHQRLHEEMDIFSVMNNISKIKLLQDLILTHKQRKLLPFVDFNLIRQKDPHYQLQHQDITIPKDKAFDMINDVLKNSNNRRDRIFLDYLTNHKFKKNLEPIALRNSSKAMKVGDNENFGAKFMMSDKIKSITSSNLRTKPTNQLSKKSIKKQKTKEIISDVDILKMNESQRVLMKNDNNYFND